MFSTTGLFKNIPCPGRSECRAVNCIFSHDDAKYSGTATNEAHQIISTPPSHDPEPPTKRRRTNDDHLDRRSPLIATTGGQVEGRAHRAGTSERNHNEGTRETPQSLNKAITPPPKSVNGKSAAPARGKIKKETLNPRILTKPPAGHEKRTLYVRAIHEQMKRLNALEPGSTGTARAALHLDEDELIKASLDEEEQLANDNPVVYANIIKQRIGVYRKMTLDEWLVHLKTKTFGSRRGQVNGQGSKPIETGLTPSQELGVLSNLLTAEKDLINLKYILTPPTEEARNDAERMADEANHYEVCDRCSTRFQVFPDRRAEDGALTTNGPCIYHWGRLRRPPGKRTDAQTGQKEPAWTCCGEIMKGQGCTTGENHVFKINDAARMSSMLPFINTPPNEKPTSDSSGRSPGAVTFDCEMGYTSCGLELIRLTAVAWPSGDEIMDILVQPRGMILDLNSRFSGVFTSHFTSALPWKAGKPLSPTRADGNTGPLPLVASPEEARSLLCSFITPATPLIGHALENDLNSVRLCHPTVVDTVALFPHPKGLPIRFGLKHLSSVHLGRDIQTGGDQGHDSLEDARATGDLVRVKVKAKWVEMRKDGWKIEGKKLVAPG